MNRKNDRIIVAIIAVLLGILAGAVIILILGKNPLSVYYSLLRGSGLAPKAKYAGGKNMLSDFSNFLDFITSMIFAALAVAVALKTGLFNIGVSGQMLVGGFIATVLIGYSGLPAFGAKPLVILVAAAGGGVIGALIGFLKYRFNINEVVSSIMLNYIASYITGFLINTRYVDPQTRQSKDINAAACLTLHEVRIGSAKYDIPLGFILAVIVIFAVAFLFDKTVFGFELKAVGLNREAARYMGINVRKSMVVSMLISGLLAGIAGATYYLGYITTIQPKVLPSIGFDAIAVCLVGGSSPIGIFFSAFFLMIISKGSTYMSSQMGLEAEISSVIMGLILLTCACSTFILPLMYKFRSRKEKGEVKA
ncbi:MAG: ABC transporter permease [Lachnospiraceae bacterium]|nr:ABC transporter permease [Lachnospiraceae bacterium]